MPKITEEFLTKVDLERERERDKKIRILSKDTQEFEDSCRRKYDKIINLPQTIMIGDRVYRVRDTKNRPGMPLPEFKMTKGRKVGDWLFRIMFGAYDIKMKNGLRLYEISTVEPVIVSIENKRGLVLIVNHEDKLPEWNCIEITNAGGGKFCFGKFVHLPIEELDSKYEVRISPALREEQRKMREQREKAKQEAKNV